MSNRSNSSVTGVLESLEDEVSSNGADVNAILNASGTRAAGPLLFLPAVVMISPVGAIPGVPIVLATLIILVSAQILIGSSRIWLPRFIRQRSVPKDKLLSMLDRIRPYARQVDRFLGNHLSILARPPMPRVVAFLCIMLALAVFPATLIPTAAALPGGAIALLSLGLLTRDGLVTLAGLLATGAAVYFLLLLS